MSSQAKLNNGVPRLTIKLFLSAAYIPRERFARLRTGKVLFEKIYIFDF
jgi:hypothetical protein